MLLSSDSKVGIAKSVGVGCISMADCFSRLKPDIVLILGDRVELLAVTATCICMGIPIAHIGGGQCTEGAIDEQIRHMITKASHLHFVANQSFGDRLLLMGEEPWRIFVTGSPSIDCLIKTNPMSCDELSQDLGLDLSNPTALVSYHPETISEVDQEELNREFFTALEELDIQLLLTYPNGDFGSQGIIEQLKRLASKCRSKRVLVPTLGLQRYVSALRYVKLMIGNSSSGIVEAPTFNLPVVNVGKRQQGRLTAENVITCEIKRDSIKKAINRALHYNLKKCNKPYGDGYSTGRIVDILLEVIESRSRSELLLKRFFSPDC
jgi:UDP-hydrolysing UDP-N-acetyl-D-glucosamine 2-epimerase